MRGDGSVYQRGEGSWWIAYYAPSPEGRAKLYRERAGDSEKEARTKLRHRIKQIRGERFRPEEEKLTVGELLNALTAHLGNKGVKSATFLSSMKPIREAFGPDRSTTINAARIEQYIQSRRESDPESPPANATINREIAVLRQAFKLAHRQERMFRIPYFPMLRENNARQGFFEATEFEAVLANLSPAYADAAHFAYLTGWRRGEISGLGWEAVDRDGGEVRLATSKNDRGRVLPLEGELAALIERRWAAREYTDRRGQVGISPLVFHRKGTQLGEFRNAWKTACKAAGCSGKLFHDLRRTAVRNMIRAGVPQTVAMSISGHRTTAMFNRYNITSNDDRRDALLRTQRHLAEQPKKDRKVVPIGAVG